MRSERKQDSSDSPSREMIQAAHSAALQLRSQSGQEGGSDSFVAVRYAGEYGSGPMSRSSDMSDVRKKSNYKKWEVMSFESIRKEARDHMMRMKGVSVYKTDGNKLEDLVCIKHSLKSTDGE